MDWVTWIINAITNIGVGFIGFVLGMWYFNKYILPKLYSNIASNLFKQAQEDPVFKPWIERFKKIIEEIEPFVAKLKTVDFEKIMEDLQPLIKTVKGFVAAHDDAVVPTPEPLPEPEPLPDKD